MSQLNPIEDLRIAERVRLAVEADQMTLYQRAAHFTSGYYYSPEQLQALLQDRLLGRSDLANLPNRTRSKVAKSLVAASLGYVVPASFPKTRPRLPHPNIDVYVQKSNNLQIWNAELDASRRYVIIRVGFDELVSGVRVVAGADLASFDTTGTLTSKFQASRRIDSGSKLVNDLDTTPFRELLRPVDDPKSVGDTSPTARPLRGTVLSISAAYRALLPMIGRQFQDPGMSQERLRGAIVHREACKLLGFRSYADNGQFPDILSQALEIKLQLARTVDLGLELPSSQTPVASLDAVLDVQDIRYALFYGVRNDDRFRITSLVMVSGAHFFEEYQQFGGRVSNSKLQLRLPADFYGD